MRIIFFGTGKFAIPILTKIAQDTNWDVLLVVTEPAKPAGRGKALTPSSVHKKAQELGLKVFTPETLKDRTAQKEILSRNPDIIITAAYGKLIPKEIFDAPPNKTINIHPSLLPKMRGPSPIQYAILEGLKETGVSLMLIDEEIDHGAVISQERALIAPDDTYDILEPKLAEIGAEMLVRDIPKYVSGQLVSQVQKHSQATFTKLIKKEAGQVDWNASAQDIYNHWRAYVRWPGMFSFAQKEAKKIRLNFIKIEISTKSGEKGPGTLYLNQEELLVQCADVAIKIFEIQPEGKRPMSARAFINGYGGLLNKKLIV